MLDLNLSTAEVVVLGDHLSIDLLFVIGERSEEELESLWNEGVRSLVARGLLRPEGDEMLVSNELLPIARDVLAPAGLLTFTRVAGERGSIGHVLFGIDSILDGTPIIEDVVMYTETTPDQVVEAILVAAADGDGATVYQIETLHGQDESSTDDFVWVRTDEGDLFRGDDGESVQITYDDVRVAVELLVGNLDDARHTAPVGGESMDRQGIVE